MTTRGKWLAGAAAGLLLGGYFAAQLLSARRGLIAMHADELRWQRHMRVLHPDAAFGPVQPVNLHYGVVLSVASLMAMLACVVVAAALTVGGRRLWALLLVGATPLTFFLGRGDANSLGLAWGLQVDHMQGWLTAGAVVDAIVVVLLTAILIAALPHRTPVVPLAPALLRTLPIAIAAFGYWLIGNALPDSHARFFVTRALLLIVAAAVIATARLPLVVRALTMFVVPFADPTMIDGLIHGYARWSTYLNHVAVGGATGAYVLAVPALTQRMRRGRVPDFAVNPSG